MAASFIVITFFAFLLELCSSAVPLSSVNRGYNSPFYDEVRQLLELNDALHQQGNLKKRYEMEKSYKKDTPKAVKNWPDSQLKLGQVSGVAVNSKNQPVIFHRADRIWGEFTFNDSNHYQQINLGPIKENTILTLHPTTGKVIAQWGANMFYMPHGISFDRHDNTWVTDVALHQVFKFRPGESEPVLTFGQRFEPGSDLRHLCKPTHAAIASTGEVFIADGYCNSRILKFNAAGGLLKVIPNPPEFLSLVVPHALALIESLDLICVADRENMRVVCPRAGLYNIRDSDKQALTIQQPDMGRVFGVASRDKQLPEFLSLVVPHALALIESLDLICVADRENMRVVCPRAGLYNIRDSDKQALTIQQPDMGRVFGVASRGEIVYAVNGPTSPFLPVRGLTIDPKSEAVIDHWAPEEGVLLIQ
ncbi:peptidyl-alpha-hydroxyglycine alpha-amidating lyase 2 [Agrilus planipennis]|uniref:peptidylamidoglycolate lyase n=1 Tax=Agrilus planipennis TaxID=224129 RepID=A0A1W4WYG3_AGRPL|nr:peptidyl-alpha-hydroxyglycine alpha-amidating lyase 2 [Agrilus planipennis]